MLYEVITIPCRTADILLPDEEFNAVVACSTPFDLVFISFEHFSGNPAVGKGLTADCDHIGNAFAYISVSPIFKGIFLFSSGNELVVSVIQYSYNFV